MKRRRAVSVSLITHARFVDVNFTRLDGAGWSAYHIYRRPLNKVTRVTGLINRRLLRDKGRVCISSNGWLYSTGARLPNG